MDNNDSNIETPLSDGENVPLTKKKEPKFKKSVPPSQKQMENFEKARIKRLENIEKAKKEKEIKMSKIYFENKLKEEKEKPLPKKPVMKYEESESESEEEIIYVKKKPPKQKNKKIVYLSDDEEDEPPRPTPKKQSRILRNEPQQQPVNNIQPIDFNNFFI
jgi:hypothetical protein